jgi:hypothetical protein
MSRQITIQGLARAVRYLERAFKRYDDEAIAEALKTAGMDADVVGFVGQTLCDIAEPGRKLLPEKPEPKCAFCGGEGEGRKNMDDTLTRPNNIYCSNACGRPAQSAPPRSAGRRYQWARPRHHLDEAPAGKPRRGLFA